ncbi:MAG: prepilin-type N-terminal cleavage/methylation domain-containing protein [Candidatus Nealsonbacteria bacterium]
MILQKNNLEIKKITKSNENGFTFLELIIVFFVFSVGILGIFAFAQNPASYARIAEQRLTATYLAQEGIELVRNIRDSNILAKNSWDSGLNNCSAGCQISYYESVLGFFQDQGFLKFNAIGLYFHNSGINTIFKRKIIIIPSGSYVNVSVEVSWEDKGEPQTPVIIEENLYNWGKDLVI